MLFLKKFLLGLGALVLILAELKAAILFYRAVVLSA